MLAYIFQYINHFAMVNLRKVAQRKISLLNVR
jgi:hypothetical protein